MCALTGWTRHHLMMDDPLAGVPADDELIHGWAEGSDLISKCYFDKVRKEYVIKTHKGVWYVNKTN